MRIVLSLLVILTSLAGCSESPDADKLKLVFPDGSYVVTMEFPITRRTTCGSFFGLFLLSCEVVVGTSRKTQYYDADGNHSSTDFSYGYDTDLVKIVLPTAIPAALAAVRNK